MRPVDVGAHGDTRIDDYFWLRGRDNPEVIAHLEAENAYTETVTAHLAPLRQTLFTEMLARIQESDLSVPVRKGEWLYYARTEEGRQYAIRCRRPARGTPEDFAPTDKGAEGSGPADEQVILDENALAEGHDYFALGSFAISPDHRLLAYSIDTNGSELYTTYIRDLETGVDLGEAIPGTYYGSAWAADSATFFYTRPDEAMRPFQLWRHRAGTSSDTDVLVMTEADERFFLGVGTTKDDAFVVASLESKITSEAHVLDAHDPEGSFRLIEGRRQGIEYHLEHHQGRFYIVTNDGAIDFALMSTPCDTPGRAHWSPVMDAEAGVKLDGIEVFESYLALGERAGGSARIRIMDIATGALTEIPQPEAVGTATISGNPEFRSTTMRYEYTSLVTPRSVYDYDMASGQAVLLKRQPVLGHFSSADYDTQRLWARAEDDTLVPVTLVYRRDVLGAHGQGAGSRGAGPMVPAPLLLYGYGSYEACMDPYFSSLRLSLLDRGFVFAIAHIRGGGEMGRAWYENGKLAHKTNTFDDFIAVARHLVAQGWTTPAQMVARGGSAGGLLMGAVANRAPELFAAMVSEVPFVDCLTTILDESLPLTVIEWEEWGNPGADPEMYDYIKAYSPYDNVAPRPYPTMLVTAGLNDPRVSYWEPAKWVAKLRRANPGGRVLLKTDMGAGHGGPSGRYDTWKDEAFVFSFILDALGLAG
ncbi:MAG: S9 family peptidase [Acidimicrobiales bacterium]